MVAGNWHHHRHGISDEVHDGILSCGSHGRSFAYFRQTVFGKRMVLGRNGTRLPDLFSQPAVAVQERIYFAAFPAAHSRSRREPGPGGRILARSSLDLRE